MSLMVNGLYVAAEGPQVRVFICGSLVYGGKLKELFLGQRKPDSYSSYLLLYIKVSEDWRRCYVLSLDDTHHSHYRILNCNRLIEPHTQGSISGCGLREIWSSIDRKMSGSIPAL